MGSKFLQGEGRVGWGGTATGKAGGGGSCSLGKGEKPLSRQREQQVQRPRGLPMTLDKNSQFQHKLCPDPVILVENIPVKAVLGALG